MKKLLAATGAMVVVAGMTLAMASAGAKVAAGGDGPEKPWPTLRVEKTYPDGRAASPGTVFTITVDCHSISADDVDAESVDAELTFIATGPPQAAPAAPDTTDNDKWVKNGQYWELTSKWLKYRECDVEETGVSPVPNNLTTVYKCSFSSTPVELAYVPVDETSGYGVSPGCLNPEIGAETSEPPATVIFTAPWDFKWVKSGDSAEVDALGTKTCDAGPPVAEPSEQGSAEDQSSSFLCQQVGIITVINDDPGNPAWEIVADLNLSFTG